MRPLLLINDLHLGVQRVGGTTQASALALRQMLVGNLRTLVMQHLDKNIVANGDIFDTFNVPMADVLAAYMIFSAWLEASKGDLFLGRGNHDIAKNSANLSSFDFLSRILKTVFPGRVGVITEPTEIEKGILMIPHLPNQDLFDLALTRAGDHTNDLILLHANWDNKFTVEADHSLNVSREQAKKLIARGNTLVFGHEHQKRIDMKGEVFITGNQWPTSIADCLGNPDGLKSCHVIIEEDGAFILEPIETWDAAQHFSEVPWDRIGEWALPLSNNFIRVVGNAAAEQAAEVIAAIAKLRASSTAYVVGNAVKIEGVNDMAELNLSVEQVRAFDVLGYLFENLEPEQAKCVKGLLAKQEPLKEAA